MQSIFGFGQASCPGSQVRVALFFSLQAAPPFTAFRDTLNVSLHCLLHEPHSPIQSTFGGFWQSFLFPLTTFGDLQFLHVPPLPALPAGHFSHIFLVLEGCCPSPHFLQAPLLPALPAGQSWHFLRAPPGFFPSGHCWHVPAFLLVAALPAGHDTHFLPSSISPRVHLGVEHSFLVHLHVTDVM